MNMLQRVSIALVACVVMALLCGPFSTQLEANADSERDLFRTLALTEQGIFPAQGPAIDFLPVHLGPGWYLAVAPALLIDRHPESVHTFHSFVFVLSLIALFWALRTRAGPWVALVTCLLLGTSHHMTQVMVRLWHNGLFPAVAVFWFVLVHRALQSEVAASRHRNWLGAWVVTALLLQLHAVGAVYFLCLFAAHTQSYRKHGMAGGWWAKASVAVPTLMCAVYGWVVAAIDWNQIQSISASRGHQGFALAEVLEKLPEHCWSAWSAPELHWIAAVVLALASWGAVRGLWEARKTWGFHQWVLVQVIVGFLAVAWLSGLHPEARYFNAIIPGLYILVALGLQDVGRWLPSSLRQWAGSGPLLLASGMVLVLWGGWFTLPTQAEEDDSHRALTLLEQEAMLDVLNRDYELSFDTLNTRVHGPLFGALTSPRYLAYIRGMVTSRNAENLAPDEEIIMVPDGFPLPATAEEIHSKEVASGRTVRWLQRKRRFDPTQVRLRYNGQMCNVRLPFHWFHLAPQEQEPFGFAPFPGMESCSNGTGLDGTLEISVHRIREDQPLSLLLAWFDVQNDYAANTRVQVSHNNQEWQTIAGHSPMQSISVYSIPKPDINTPLRIRIQPVRALASLDLY